MNEKYTSLIKLIAVVDDDPANRAAAIAAIKELLPHVAVVEFENGDSTITSINSPSNSNPQPDLVLSDMIMEDRHAGWRVATASWAWGIPATVISGGFKSHTEDLVRLGYPNCQPFSGEKTDPALWKRLLEVALSGEYHANALLMALKLGKSASPDIEKGETASVVVAGSIVLNVWQ